MHIAFYIDSLKLGGAERVLLLWAGWCVQNHWHVTVITRQGLEQDVYPLPAGVQRRVESPLPYGLECFGWWAFPLRVWSLRLLLKQLGPLNCAVGVTTLPSIKLLLAAHGGRIRCLVSERNFPPAKRPALPWRLLRRFTYPWADLHLVQTSITGDWLKRHCGADRQRLMPNPVTWPLPDRDPRLDPDDWLDSDVPMLLAAGTKAHQKGFDQLMQVFSLLALRHPSLRLVILGLSTSEYHGCDQQAMLRDLLPEDGALQRQLLFPGMVGNMSSWYERATIFVLPSRYEGFPNVLLEAMAAGCACVASDCDAGPRDLIDQNLNGMLLPSGATSNMWAETLDELLTHPVRRRRLANAAKGVRERYAESVLRCDFLESLKALVYG